MGTEKNISIVVDSGSSMRENYPEVIENQVSVLPLEIKFYENGNWVPYLDSEISSEDFYSRMSQSEKLPQTSGAVTGRALDLYKSLSGNSKGVISIHITSLHSVAYESALLAANMVKEVNPEIVIEVIDSKVVSLGTWLLAQKASLLAEQGFPIADIKRQILETIPKVEVFAMLSSLDNLVKGGRITTIAGMLGSFLQIKPIVGFVDGKITQLSKTRTQAKAKQELIHRVSGINEEIVNLTILHTNNESGATELKQDLQQFYSKDIPIYEAGPVLGVHAGPGAVGIALLKK